LPPGSANFRWRLDMRLKRSMMAAGAVLLLGHRAAFAQSTGAPYVYVSNPEAGQILKVVNGQQLPGGL